MAATDTLPIAISATEMPSQFNVATYFVDRNVADGRGDNVAIEVHPGNQRITYRQVLDGVNRFGNSLRNVLGVRIEERVLLLLLDCPEYAYAFFGAIKIGAVPIPTNTLFKPADYEYLLNDSRARVVVVSEALLPQLQAVLRSFGQQRQQGVSHAHDPAPSVRIPSVIHSILGGARCGYRRRSTAPGFQLARAFQLSPAAGTVVGDDLLEHGGEGGRVDRLAPANGHRAGGLVVVAGGDDRLRIRHDRAVVEEHVDVVLGRQQGTDVALQDEVRLPGSLDGLGDLGIGGVDQVADLAADGLLPVRQGIDVGVDARVRGVGHDGSSCS